MPIIWSLVSLVCPAHKLNTNKSCGGSVDIANYNNTQAIFNLDSNVSVIGHILKLFVYVSHLYLVYLCIRTHSLGRYTKDGY